MILLKNASILKNENDLQKKDVLIVDDKIFDIQDCLDEDETLMFAKLRNNLQNKKDSLQIVDLGGKWLVPGGVDVHGHLREPGFENKETILTGTKSASKGGITTILAMANLKPVPDSVQHLEVERKLLNENAVVKVIPFASTTVGLLGKEVSDIEGMAEMCIGFSDDGKGVQDMSILKSALEKATKVGKIVSSHAEVEEFGFSEKSEIEAVKRELKVVETVKGAKYHFCHMSTKESLQLVREAQKNGLDVSCEVAPHHLVLQKSAVNGNANFKMNPPLRSEEDRIATLEALLDGTATMIATDHAPHTEEEKAREFDKAPNGIIGFETMFPIVFTNLVKTGLATKKQMLDWCVFNPAKRFSITANTIEIGQIADLAVLDIENKHTYEKNEILSKGKNSPFIGCEFYGMNTMTLVNGKIVFSVQSN